MEKYIFIQDDFNWYMIPLKSREQFNELLSKEDDNELIPDVFEKYYLETHISNTPFYRVKDVEGMYNFPTQLPEGIPSVISTSCVR